MKKVKELFKNIFSKQAMKKMVEIFYQYIVLPIMVLFIYIGLNLTEMNSLVVTLINTIFSIMTIYYICKIAKNFTKMIEKDNKIAWTLTTTVVLIALAYILTFSDRAKESNTLFILGIVFFEAYSLYVIISCCFYEKTNLVKVVIFTMLFIGAGYYAIRVSTYVEDPLKNNDIYNSLMGVFAAIVGGGITLIGVAWTINYQEKLRKIDAQEKENKKEEELLSTCPLITFLEIDSIDPDEGVFLHGDSPNCLMMKTKNEVVDKETEEANLFLRFKFKSNPKNQLKNISFNYISIYTNFKDSPDLDTRKYEFYEIYRDLKFVNISIADDSIYQVCSYLLFGTEEGEAEGYHFRNNKIKRDKVVTDMVETSIDKWVFFNIDYKATNMKNVSYSATLKFGCHLIRDNYGKYKFQDYSNISNWITKQPHILK